MGTFHIQRGEDIAIDLYDQYKISVREITSLSENKETELGDNKHPYNTIVRVAISSNQMNLLTQFTNYIGSRVRGQFDKNLRGEPRNGVFQLADFDSNKGYRLSYVNMADTGLKEGKIKILDLLFMNETPQTTLDLSHEIYFGNVECDIFFSDGALVKGAKNKHLSFESEWALVIPENGEEFVNEGSIFSGEGFVKDSQTIEKKDGEVIISAKVVHKGVTYSVKSYDNGGTWHMLAPLYENIHTSPKMTIKEIGGNKVCYYSREILQEIDLPAGFRLPTLKDMLNLDGWLAALDCMGDFYNEKTLYGFVENLKLYNSISRSAFWAIDHHGEVRAAQFIEKGGRIVCERMHVEGHTFLPVLGILKTI